MTHFLDDRVRDPVPHEPLAETEPSENALLIHKGAE
jgi:hypothetical protein